MLLMGVEVEEGYTSSPTFNGSESIAFDGTLDCNFESPSLNSSFETLKAQVKPKGRDRKKS